MLNLIDYPRLKLIELMKVIKTIIIIKMKMNNIVKMMIKVMKVNNIVKMMIIK